MSNEYKDWLAEQKQVSLIEYLNTIGDWRERLAAAPYSLKVKDDGEYTMLSYQQFASDFTYRLVREARGCVVKRVDGEWRYVCRAMDKFGNVGEDYVDLSVIDWNHILVQEKIDGSLIKIWFDKGWHISTNGTIDAFKAPLGVGKYNSFGDLFLDTLRQYYPNEHDFFGVLSRDYTYFFELVSPFNQVVIPYEDNALYFLGWRNNEKGFELHPFGSAISKVFPLPQVYPIHTLEDAREAAAALGEDKEGFVIRDTKFHRVKVKSPEYVMRHHFRTGVMTDEALVHLILTGETEEVLAYAPELGDRIDGLRVWMHDTYEQSESARRQMAEWIDKPKKDFARRALAFGKFSDYLFKWYDKGLNWDEYVHDWTASKWIRFMKENG